MSRHKAPPGDPKHPHVFDSAQGCYKVYYRTHPGTGHKAEHVFYGIGLNCSCGAMRVYRPNYLTQDKENSNGTTQMSEG